MAHSLLPTPNLLLQTQKRYLLPSTLSLSLQPEPKLWPAVPKDDIVPAPSPAPVLALAFKRLFLSLLSSSPKPRHRARWPRRPALRKVERNTMLVSPGAIHAAATLRELDPEEEDDGGMLVDQELGADAMTVFVRLECELPSSSSSAKELLEALSEPSAAGVPHTPSANSNSASTALPLLLPTLSPSSSSSASSNPRLVLQVTHADMCLPGDAPHLEGLCSRTVGLPVKDMMREELDQEQELDEDRNLDLDLDIGDEDRIIGRIQDFIDENDDIFRAKDREQKTASSGPSTTAKRKRDKYVSAELQERRKPRRKRLRELGRITDAVVVVDPFTPKKSLETVVGHIRRFVQNLGSAPTLSLPPTARHTRNSVLSGAHAFSLKSQSAGKNATRFTRLIETTLGDVWVDERNVAWVLAKPLVQGRGKGRRGERSACGMAKS
ncbi:hypothetical protein EDB85DRAFT_2295144 [Lactarius pseudohatsudake]|nr:hypothetical protein EDB85DRAFT_2295144 [Lactarius pseudohatsudake]